MISFRHKGDFSNLEKILSVSFERKCRNILDRFGQAGVDALARATPKKTGKTASSWSYEVSSSKGSSTITWKNSNVNEGVNIAMIIQYGHGTRNGAYVRGIDYINPALKSIFDELAESAWKEVTAG